jgi:hypothetical protein
VLVLYRAKPAEPAEADATQASLPVDEEAD